MALPKIDVPTYDLILPICKKTVTYRPFLVKEQKILFMASESNDPDTIEKSMRQILQNCVISELDIADLTLVDMEYFFIHVRARSAGEKLEAKFKCENVIDEVECGNIMDVTMDLTQVTVSNLESYDDIVKLTDDVGVKMKMPKFSLIKLANDSTGPTDLLFDMVADCIEYIYEGEQLHYSNEIPRKEIVEFLESLNEQQFGNIQKYFDKIPKVVKFINVTCKKCGFNHHIEFEGIESFFD